MNNPEEFTSIIKLGFIALAVLLALSIFGLSFYRSKYLNLLSIVTKQKKADLQYNESIIEVVKELAEQVEQPKNAYAESN